MMNDTVTIYNKCVQAGAEKWQRTVLKGVFWDSVEGAVLRRTGAASADSVVVVIPRTLPGYLKPKAWDALMDRRGHWTVRPGDILVRGQVGIEIVRSAAKELEHLDDVRTVTTVDDLGLRSGMAHLEVSGK